MLASQNEFIFLFTIGLHEKVIVESIDTLFFSTHVQTVILYVAWSFCSVQTERWRCLSLTSAHSQVKGVLFFGSWGVRTVGPQRTLPVGRIATFSSNLSALTR